MKTFTLTSALVIALGNSAALAGYTDWRIPNWKELDSIVDLSVTTPCIDGTTFPSTPSTYHWTSSHGTAAHPYNIQFNYGECRLNQLGISTKHYVRLVR